MKADLNANGKKEANSKDDQLSLDVKNLNLKEVSSEDGKAHGSRAQTFTFDELAAATGNFRSDCFLGEGGFGKVYKGYLEKVNQVGSEPKIWTRIDLSLGFIVFCVLSHGIMLMSEVRVFV